MPVRDHEPYISRLFRAPTSDKEPHEYVLPGRPVDVRAAPAAYGGRVSKPFRSYGGTRQPGEGLQVVRVVRVAVYPPDEEAWPWTYA